ncbi:putative HNH nuclease [Lupinus albus]|uniref:Putative HNH nuclease n=1 Tax=Lupinus albus TaxID=3870 RepID=A0A6A4QEY9_LUPAL|nr:putative HNH nuclease [Lupinus albus]
MAQFLFNGECLFSLLDHKDPFFQQKKCNPSIQNLTHHRKRLRKHIGYSATIHYSSSSYFTTKTNRCNAKMHPSVGNESAHYDDDDDDDDFDDDEFENDDLSCFQGLVLDISYRPVNVVGWKRAICLEFMEKADVLEYYAQTVNSPSGSFYIPAVLRSQNSTSFRLSWAKKMLFSHGSKVILRLVRQTYVEGACWEVPYLLQVVKRKLLNKNLSRKNILFRDNSTCQYCSSRENLTVDHVVPIALGGEWKWENLVTACVKCNSKKGHKTLEEAKMRLIKVPKAPKDYDILAIPLTSAAIQMMAVKKRTPEEWRQYLSKSSSEP